LLSIYTGTFTIHILSLSWAWPFTLTPGLARFFSVFMVNSANFSRFPLQILQCLITEYVDGFTLSAYLDKHFHRDFTWKLLFKVLPYFNPAFQSSLSYSIIFI